LSNLAIAAVLGYAVVLIPALWCWYDLGSFHRPLWVGYGSRARWRGGLVTTYALGGWPALFVVLSWRTGRIRSELRDERDRWSEYA
jgi:hypothetical protein